MDKKIIARIEALKNLVARYAKVLEAIRSRPEYQADNPPAEAQELERIIADNEAALQDLERELRATKRHAGTDAPSPWG